MTYFFMFLVCIGGSFVQRVSGFGLGIFSMLFLPYFMSSQAAAATVSSLVSCVGSLYNSIRYRKEIRFRTMLPLLAACLFVIPVAVHFSAVTPDRILKPMLGVVLVLLSIYFLVFSKKIRIRPTIPNGILAGALGGTLSGLFSTGGPPAVIYLLNATGDNLTYFATIQAYFTITNIYSTVMRALNGLITGEVLRLFAVGLGGWLLGDILGRKVFDRLDQEKLKKIIYVGMIVSGVLMCL